ncbi:MAG: tRNA pseudouridine(38-40) synthase TruA [Lachnospiraceae bacterium]|nr:tRNA pseudouridine(38-40) synthase TruA [Lachnospiraceae bacterium]
MMRNIRLKISYDGTRYQGWQRQKSTNNTIQGKIEQILSKMTGHKIEINGSGRTDAGVHARAQVANFKTDCSMSVGEIKEYLNEYLPLDIAVTEVKDVSERFHSRLNVVGKRYIYRVWNSTEHNVFERKYLYPFIGPLNLDKMKQAADLLIGTHDFQSFCGRKMKKKSTVRTMKKLEIEKNGHEIRFLYEGDGFLFHMVRILTGTLLEIGTGEIQLEDLPAILESKTRENAGRTAPACGLILDEVFYD